MKKGFVIFFLISLAPLFAQKSDVTYSFDCLNEDLSGSMISLFGGIESEMLSTFGTSVSIEEEIQVGDQVFEEIKKKYKLSQDQVQMDKLNRIMNKIVSQISNPRGFNYKIYVLDTTELNAFTIGGKIFYTTEMLKFCQSDDEIAAVIGHEIGHNELGNINDQLKRIKSAQGVFGEETGQLIAGAGKIMTISFNQKNEAHCDMFGVDLSISAGYRGCEAAGLWNRMHQKFEGQDSMPRLFMSHPYSSDREACLKYHISENYSTECK